MRTERERLRKIQRLLNVNVREMNSKLQLVRRLTKRNKQRSALRNSKLDQKFNS